MDVKMTVIESSLNSQATIAIEANQCDTHDCFPRNRNPRKSVSSMNSPRPELPSSAFIHPTSQQVEPRGNPRVNFSFSTWARSTGKIRVYNSDFAAIPATKTY